MYDATKYQQNWMVLTKYFTFRITYMYISYSLLYIFGVTLGPRGPTTGIKLWVIPKSITYIEYKQLIFPVLFSSYALIGQGCTGLYHICNIFPYNPDQ